ncbi:hypothetical protein Tsubulata_023558 [Turnera subulata]|uniref:TLC domain-containing protein n=1 Tax=Turnera subulata TaxID=218843 RepID=A0A9Q0FZV2_9ROSI|nr:hypothetical protein Tsubulata_023558 [Turnera subulata]
MGLMEHVKSIDWEDESYPAYEDYIVLPLFALFFPTVRFFLDRFVFQKVGTRLIFGKGHHLLDLQDDERKKKIRKFKESAWKCVYFLSAEILALLVTYNEPWFTNTKNYWVGPGTQVWPDQKMKLKLKGVYMYAAGFYTYSIFALIFWETRRSDFGVSMGHHVATVILIVLSYILRFGRVGSVVLALHDASDVFLEVGKMSKYSGAEGTASFAFILFVLSWILLRLIYFPFWVLWSTSYEVVQTLDKEKHPVDGPIYYYVFNTLLFCLLVLHIYWWVLIYRMLVKQIQARGQLSDDVRSDSSMYVADSEGLFLSRNVTFVIQGGLTQMKGLYRDFRLNVEGVGKEEIYRVKKIGIDDPVSLEIFIRPTTPSSSILRQKDMEDVLTEIPPPSRFFQEELNNFTPPPQPLPSPFLVFSNPKPDQPLRPSLLIIALSTPSHFVFHNVSNKSLIGSLILPEVPFAGNSVEPSLGDKSCNIYALNGAPASDLVLVVSVQCPVSADRANVVAKVLLGEHIVPQRVLILDSVQSQNFRAKLSPDETYAFKLETTSEREGLDGGSGDSALLKGLDYFPSGSVVEGLAAALLSRCQMRNIRGTLCVSWPQYSSSVVVLIKSLLQKKVLQGFDFGSSGEDEEKYLRSRRIKDHPFDSELYT